jgi:hypothetical protein
VSLAEQERLQLRADAGRSSLLVWIFVAGFLVSALGAWARLPLLRAEGFRRADGLMAFGVLYFGAGLAMYARGRWWTRPRIVPVFEREMAPYGGPSSHAFRTGGHLYRRLSALDALASRAGVAPLSSFGFEDDYYEQEVRWHRAADGVRSVEALQQARPPDALAGLTSDLEALASVLRLAAERDIAFRLVLRLRPDSLQAVSSMEVRSGRFW